MTTYAWEPFFRQWNEEMLQDPEIAGSLPPEVIASGWLGYPGASEAQLAEAEAHLGATLPSSYREFLKVTNGWRRTGIFFHQVWSTEEIEWFATNNQYWIDAYVEEDAIAGGEPVPDEEYFVYGDEQSGFSFRLEYLQTTLQISEVGDSCIYLLNPQVVTPDGEWEAWFFSTWGGAWRHRSFWDMMQVERENSLDLKDI